MVWCIAMRPISIQVLCFCFFVGQRQCLTVSLTLTGPELTVDQSGSSPQVCLRCLLSVGNHHAWLPVLFSFLFCFIRKFLYKNSNSDGLDLNLCLISIARIYAELFLLTSVCFFSCHIVFPLPWLCLHCVTMEVFKLGQAILGTFFFPKNILALLVHFICLLI